MNKINDAHLFESLLRIMLADAEAHIRSTKKRENILAAFETFNEFCLNQEAVAIEDIQINGNDIMTILGINGPSKEIGEILNDVLKKVINEDLDNTKRSITKYILKTYKKAA